MNAAAFRRLLILLVWTRTCLFMANAADSALVQVTISPEGRVKAASEVRRPALTQQAWTEFDIVIENGAGLTAPFDIESKQLMTSLADAARDRWLRLEIVPSGPLTGQREEKRTLRLWSRDAGRRSAVMNVNAGQGSQDLGFRSDLLLTFVIAPASKKSIQPEGGVPAAGLPTGAVKAP